MPKKYETDGRDLYNHRGRFGRLTLVPSSKSSGDFVNCDTYGTGLRAMKSEFDPNVVSLVSEPVVFNDAFPSGKMHLDLREGMRKGYSNTIEIKDIEFFSEKEIERQRLAKDSIEKNGDTHELVMRHDIFKYAKAMSLQFLYRYLKWKPPHIVIEQVATLCFQHERMRRTEWVREFSDNCLPAKALYWAIAKGYLAIVDEEGLFPDGYIQGKQQ